MSIGESLRQARSAAELTQEMAAEKAGVSRQTMSNWENGKSYPDIASVIALSDVYGVTLDSLLKGDIAMIKYLKESTDLAKSNRQVVATLIAMGIALLGTAFIIMISGGRIYNYVDVPTWLILLFPLLVVLTVTRSFKLFFSGLRAAVFPKKEMEEGLRAQAALLFRLLSKTSAMAIAIGTLINAINIGLDVHFNNSDIMKLLPLNIAATLLLPLFSLLLIAFVFEPVVYILNRKNTL